MLTYCKLLVEQGAILAKKYLPVRLAEQQSG